MRSRRFVAGGVLAVLGLGGTPGLLGLALWPEVCRACSCAGKTPAAYVQAADQVFFARAERATRDSDDKTRERQRLAVLAALKGNPGASFSVTRPADAVGCERRFEPGEVALVFAVAGRVEMCDGNYALDAVDRDLPGYFPEGPVAASREVVERALGGAFAAQLPAGASRTVVLASAHGKTFGSGGRTFKFVGTSGRPGEHAADAILVEEWRHGPIRLVQVSDPETKLRATVLLLAGGHGLELLHEAVSRVSPGPAPAPP